ncbi:right-handed parallel beta-helix repeat-containing protein [Ramlibacter sp. WS9]|uniref:right-handed parallel beta-helix repeat-containing protein n=1 Tax=Ramlibacter sp. WS9 TaxID=1882741 RepID=UPI00130536AE|nr:right-handed parallel beta-helix repeat-containing protein [Ramlibacter sp. WS9]
MISGELAVRNGQVIAPAAGAQVTFKAATAYTGRFITSVDKSFTVRGITFDGNYANRFSLEGNDVANLMNISGGTNVTLENNTFQYAPAQAIWTYRSPSIQIRGNTFLEAWQPIRMDANNLTAGVIENNTFKNTTAYKSIQHITAVNATNLVVRGNTMEGAGVLPASSHGYEGTWGNAIYIFNSTGYVVENNTVGRNYWSSLVVGQNSTNVTVRNNSFTGGTLGNGGLQSAWIEQVGANTINFTGNTLMGGLSVGDTGGDYLTITNNIITVPPGGTGIDCNYAFKHGTISGNTIKALNATKPDMGIYLWQKDDPSTNIQLLNNAISGFNKGVAVNNLGGAGTVYGIHLSGNTFASNNANVWVPSTIKLNTPLGQ